MFNSKKKKFEKAANRFLTGSGLLKAAVDGDQDTLKAMVTGHGADKNGLWYALQTFFMVANRHPEIIEGLRTAQMDMPDKAQTAFRTGIEASLTADPNRFQGGTVLGQGLLIISLSVLISENDVALMDAMTTLGENA